MRRVSTDAAESFSPVASPGGGILFPWAEEHRRQVAGERAEDADADDDDERADDAPASVTGYWSP